MEPNELGRLVDRHAAPLVLFARQWCAGAEDVVQEAFIKLASQHPPPHNAAAWLYQVVRRAALSAARSERRRQQHEVSAARDSAPWFQANFEQQLDAATATAALRQLPVEEREVMVAHLWGGLTFAEIGQIAGCSASTAHRRYLSGLQLLRQRLGVECQNSTVPPTNSTTSSRRCAD